MAENTDSSRRDGSGTSSGQPDSSPKDEIGLLDVLKLLIDSRKARTTADLVRYAGQYGAPEAEERLRVLEVEGIPMDLAFDAVSVHLRILSHKRHGILLSGCKGKKVGLLLPLPLHVAELFVPICDAVFMQPDEGPLHGALHKYAEQVIKGSRASRAKAQEMDFLVFECFKEGNVLFVDVSSSDVLEPKMLPAGIRLIAHLRPHSNPQDVEYHPTTGVAFI